MKYSIKLVFCVPKDPEEYVDILYKDGSDSFVNSLTMTSKDDNDNLVLYFRKDAESAFDALNNVIADVMTLIPEAIQIDKTIERWFE